MTWKGTIGNYSRLAYLIKFKLLQNLKTAFFFILKNPSFPTSTADKREGRRKLRSGGIVIKPTVHPSPPPKKNLKLKQAARLALLETK